MRESSIFEAVLGPCGPYIETERVSQGVKATVECERCLREHSATRYTQDESETAVLELLCRCPCYEEKPEMTLLSIIRKLLRIEKSMFRNMIYNRDRKSWFVQCSCCRDMLLAGSAKHAQDKATASKMMLAAGWQIEPIVICSKCAVRQSSAFAIEPLKDVEINDQRL